MEEASKSQAPFISLALMLKSSFDVILGVCLFLLIFPVLIFIAIAIKLDSSGPVFFKQKRVGIKGRQFLIYKFRTMVVNAVNIGAGLNIVDNDPRITVVGKFLRDWSLDELPQIINIVKGEMSFIGPRPTLQYQVDNYTGHQRKRLNMKPGVTGWSQVNGRNNISWEDRIDLDVWYVENWSPWLDMKIALKTPAVVVNKDNIYSETGISYDFKGTENSKKK